MNERGASLIEIVLVLAIIGFTGLLIANLPASIASVTKSQHHTIANDVVTKHIESLRQSGFANLEEGENSISDSSLSPLSSATASYEIKDVDDQLKSVTVTVWWNEIGKPQSVTATTLVAEGGLGQ